MSLFQRETPYRAETTNKETGEVVETSSGTLGHETTTPSLDQLFDAQDALRDRFKRLKKFIVAEVPVSDDRQAGLVKLDEALASLVVGITKEMK